MALVWRGLGRARVPVTVRRLQPTLLPLPPLRTLVLSRSGPAREQQRGSMGGRGGRGHSSSHPPCVAMCMSACGG